MRSPKMRIRINPVLTAALVLSFFVVVQIPASENRNSTDCLHWSLKGVRLGMTLEQAQATVKASNRKLKHGRNRLRPDNRGKDWYFWADKRSRGRHNYILPNKDEPASPIISIVVPFGSSEVDTSEVLKELVSKWGDPVARSVPVGTEFGVGFMGVAGGRVDWTVTLWQDRECDVFATLTAKEPLSSSPSAAQLKEFIVSLDSFKKVIEEKVLEPRNREVFLRH